MPWRDPAVMRLPYAADADEPGAGTSREAAVAFAPDAAAVRDRLDRWFLSRRSFGATDIEAETALGIDRCTLIPRRHDLKDRIVFSGRKRTRLVNGRAYRSKVWVSKKFKPEAPCG
jgi:hypothetical protein